VGDETAFRSFAARLARGRDLADRDDAARELLARYAARLVAVSRRRLGPRLAAKVDAEDVLQSVLRTFFRRLDAGAVELRGWAGLWGYLSLTTLRKCQRAEEWYAAAGRDPGREVSIRVGGGELAIPDRSPTPEEAAAFTDELEALLGGLDDQARETAELMLAGHSADAVAKRLGCSMRTVRRTFARIRQQARARRGPASGR